MVTKVEKVEPLSADEEQIVRALSRIIMTLPRLLDADLANTERLRLTEYSALMHLSEAPGRQMRMNELAAAVDVSMSGLTAIVARLESQGLIERVKCPTDGRGLTAVLTRAGLRLLQRAYVTHLASVRTHVISQIPDADVPMVARALSAIADDARRGCRGQAQCAGVEPTG